MADTRYCRICWNTQGWQHPTGEAAKIEVEAYVTDHGFGHEEWLFNYGWLINGFRYAYIQPLREFKSLNELNVILYTVAPGKQKLFVGLIESCELVSHSEATDAVQIFKENGWLDEMSANLRKINVDPTHLDTEPFNLINIRFKPEDVNLLDPFIPVPSTHKIYRINRYQPLMLEQENDWELIISSEKDTSKSTFEFQKGRLKSEDIRKRSAQRGTSYSPSHDKIQNQLFDQFVKQFGVENVGYESKGVDLAVKHGDEIIFFELKMETTAKRCVRLALGQLLEYSHWPEGSRAQKLVVVGVVPPTDDDKKYLQLLRSRYGLQIYYRQYESSSKSLGEEH